MTNIFSMIPRRRVLKVAGAVPIAAAFGWPSLAADAPLKIGIIGAGKMGGALGTAWAKAGHQVMFSTRKPDELKDLVAAAGPNAHAGTVSEAAAFGDVVVDVVPYSAWPGIAKEVGKVLASKPLLLDVSNPVPERDGDEGSKALAEGPIMYLEHLMPGTHVVRGFNAVNYLRVPTPTMPNGDKQGVAVAGDDRKAIDITMKLARDIGFDPVLVGPAAAGKYLYRPSDYFLGNHSAAELREIAKQLPKT